jgi:hypothetical protein
LIIVIIVSLITSISIIVSIYSISDMSASVTILANIISPISRILKNSIILIIYIMCISA